MAKAILVMDMPEHCFNCKLMAEKLAYGPQCVVTRQDANATDRPADCPLIPAIGYVQPVGNMVSWEDDGDVD